MGLSSKQVSSDGNGWNQALLEGPRTLEFPKTSPNMNKNQQQQDQPEQLNCPRCDSSNTKFCYYNNYNKSQPRHFCKACKRHWTKGGTLRNVPVGGGRKNKRLKPSKPASKTTTTTTNNNNINMGGTLHSQHIRASLPLGGSFASNNKNIIEDKNFSEAFYHNFLKQQHRSLPESSINFTSKGLNDGIYLDSTMMKTTSLGLSTQHHHEHQDNIQLFPYTNLLGSFDSNNNNNPCSISTTNTSIQSPSVYNFTSNDHGNNDGLLDNDHHHHHPWTMNDTSSTRNNNINVNNNISSNININNNVVDMMSSNWGGWDDFDKFVAFEADLTMPLDDEDIKP